MCGYQAGLAKHCIESEVLDTSTRISSGEYRKRSVLHVRDIPQVTNRCYIPVVRRRRDLSVNRRNKPIKLQRTPRLGREHTLWKHHNAIVPQGSPFRQGIHSLFCTLNFLIQRRHRARREFASSVITPVNSKREPFGPTSQKIHRLVVCAPPIPGNKCNRCCEILLVHQLRQFAKMQETISGFERRVIDDEAGVRFRTAPANILKYPFQIHRNRYSTAEMLPHVESRLATT